jgi:hypothetical protein
MKITVVHDNDGRILAAVMDGEEYDSTTPRPRPVPGEGLQLGTFEVPASVDSPALEEICTAFRVDSKSKTLVKR